MAAQFSNEFFSMRFDCRKSKSIIKDLPEKLFQIEKHFKKIKGLEKIIIGTKKEKFRVFWEVFETKLVCELKLSSDAVDYVESKAYNQNTWILIRLGKLKCLVLISIFKASELNAK